MKTFREYLNENSFEDVWTSIVENFEEPETVKPVYAEYYDKLKALPFSEPVGNIEITGSPSDYPEGMCAAPDFLIDKPVKTDKKNDAEVAAILIYWASLHTFYTSQEHDADLSSYLDIIESDDPRNLGAYLTETMKPKPYEAEKQDSLDRKQRLFWDVTHRYLSSSDWRTTLYILKRKLQYDMGFMNGFADHAGREDDAIQMQVACDFIDVATQDLYPDDTARFVLSKVFTLLSDHITKWSD